jgi:transposase
VGRSALNPRCLTAVWTLALLRGVTSSVRLAALCGQDLEFRWLLGDAPVEKSTLCDFRKEHGEALASLSTQVLGALGRNGLLPGENLGVDGTIVRAASSRRRLDARKPPPGIR